MKDTTFSIIQVLQYISSLSRGGYCRASQDTLIKLLKRYYGVSICRRTLNYHLLKLRKNDFLHQIRRHRAGPDGKIIFATTINILKTKALKHLARVAHWYKRVKWSIRSSADASKRAVSSQLSAFAVANAQRVFLKNHRPL